MTRHSWPRLVAWRDLQLALRAARRRQQLANRVTPDAVLQMHDVIAFLQIGEIDVQQRTRGLRVRRFEPARTLHFVAAENLRVGDDDELARRSKRNPRASVPSEVSGDRVARCCRKPYSPPDLRSKRWRSPSLLQKTWTA